MAAAALAGMRDHEQKPATRQFLFDQVEKGVMAEDAIGFWVWMYNDTDLIYEHIDEVVGDAVGIAPVLWGPNFDRNHPRFMELADALGLTDYWTVAGPPDLCRYQGDRLICD